MAKKEPDNKTKGTAQSKTSTKKATPKKRAVKASSKTATKPKSSTKKPAAKPTKAGAKKAPAKKASSKSARKPLDTSSFEFSPEQKAAFDVMSLFKQEMAVARIHNPEGTQVDWYKACPSGTAKTQRTMESNASEAVNSPEYQRFWKLYITPQNWDQLARAQEHQEHIIKMYVSAIDAGLEEIERAKEDGDEPNAAIVNAGRAAADSLAKMGGHNAAEKSHVQVEDVYAREKEEAKKKAFDKAVQKMPTDIRETFISIVRTYFPEFIEEKH